MSPTLDTRAVRRLALARAGLLGTRLTGAPSRAGRGERHARAASLGAVERVGYLQLDTVSVSGARTHGLVLASRLDGFDASLAENLLTPGGPFFEYWGHEACWMPLSLYPAFAFRRDAFRRHPWWGDIIEAHPEAAQRVLDRLRDEGPLRSSALSESEGAVEGYWNVPLTRKVVGALWSSGELAVRERVGFQRVWDLAERVIPQDLRERPLGFDDALEVLLLKALDGHGWATTSTLRATWRLRKCGPDVARALQRLVDAGSIVPCAWTEGDRQVSGWIQPADLELAEALRGLRPRLDRGVLLSPFDWVLWDRDRVQDLFGFEQRIEIYVPPQRRRWGYYCLPVLAGEHLIGRVDLRAERASGELVVVSRHVEPRWQGHAAAERAMEGAIERHARAVTLRFSPH